jgi:hypothetical protein
MHVSCSRITCWTVKHKNYARIQSLTTRIPQKLLHTSLDYTNVLVIMKLAMSKYFECERGRIVNIAALQISFCIRQWTSTYNSCLLFHGIELGFFKVVKLGVVLSSMDIST